MLEDVELPVTLSDPTTLGLFVIQDENDPAFEVPGAEGFAFIEFVPHADVVSAVQRGIEAVGAARCRAALLAAWGTATRGEETDRVLQAWILARAGDVDSGSAMLVRGAATVQDPGAGEAMASLTAACRSAQITPTSLKLLSALTDEPAPVSFLESFQSVLARDGAVLPHCALGRVETRPTPAAALMVLGELVIALRERVLPATQGIDGLEITTPYAGDTLPRPWLDSNPRRAALLQWSNSTVGALVLEEAENKSFAAPARRLHSRPTELTLFSAGNRRELIEQLQAVKARLAVNPTAPLDSLVQEYPAELRNGCRAAITADNGTQLCRRIEKLLAWLSSSQAASYQTPDGIYFAEQANRSGKTAFLLPGQGSQYLGMLGDLCLHLPQLQVWFERLGASVGSQDPGAPQYLIAPPRFGIGKEGSAELKRRLYDIAAGGVAALAGSLGLHEILTAVGVRPDVMVGYSNGENAALIAAGAWRFSGADQIFEMLAEVRRRGIFEDTSVVPPRGTSAAVNRAALARVRELVEASGGRVFLALQNCPDQVVLFGEAEALGEMLRVLAAEGAQCQPLPFDRGHHTPLFQESAQALHSLYHDFEFGPAAIPLYSCATAGLFPADPAAARALAASQWSQCVRFEETVRNLYAEGVRCFVEVGPNATLTGFVRSTLRGRPHAAIPCNVQGRPGLEQLLKLLGQLYVQGHNVNLAALRPTPAVTPRESRVALPAREAPDREAPSLPTKPPRVPAPSVEHLPAAAAGAMAVAAPPPPAEVGRHLLEQHFELMRSFLDSQQRSLARLTETLAGLPLEANSPSAAPPAWPLLGTNAHVAGNRLQAHRTFRLSEDRFLLHHMFGHRHRDPVECGYGLAVMAFTFSMELAAEAAARLAGWNHAALLIRDIRATRWLALDEDTATVAVEAEQLPDENGPGVRVRIFEETANGRALALEGTVSAGTVEETKTLAPVLPGWEPRLTVEAFHARLFHGPAMLSFRQILAVDESGVEVEAAAPSLAGVFPGDGEPPLRTPAALLDAAGQIVAYWLMEQGAAGFGLFPIRVDRYFQLENPAPGSPILLRARIRDPRLIVTADVELLDPSGKLLAGFRGLRMRRYDYPASFNRFLVGTGRAGRLSVPDAVPGKSGPARRIPAETREFLQQGPDIWLRVLARLGLAPAERDTWRRLPTEESTGWLLQRLLAKEIALDLVELEGRPLRPSTLEATVYQKRVLVHGDPLTHLAFHPEVQTEPMGSELGASLVAHPTVDREGFDSPKGVSR